MLSVEGRRLDMYNGSAGLEKVTRTTITNDWDVAQISWPPPRRTPAGGPGQGNDWAPLVGGSGQLPFSCDDSAEQGQVVYMIMERLEPGFLNHPVSFLPSFVSVQCACG
jgi:hypothetical protein